MKKHIFTFVLAIALFPLTFAQVNWSADPAHTNARFAIKHLGLAMIDGEFTQIEGTIKSQTATDFKNASFDFTIDVNSINTRVQQRDDHLKSADFFDVEKYPTMTFKNATLKHKKKNQYTLTGDLTIHGVTKKTTFIVVQNNGIITDPWGMTRAGFTAKTKINRRDFNMNYGNPLPNGVMDVASDVQIEVNLEVVKQD